VVSGARGEAGKSRAGCLLTLLVVILVTYYGFGIGQVYYRYWRLKDEMRTQARLAPGIDDDTIRRRLQHKVEELELPEEARRLRIRRTARPREINITTTYQDTLNLPFYRYPLTLTIEARQPL
jgi:hypothetical protein